MTRLLAAVARDLDVRLTPVRLLGYTALAACLLAVVYVLVVVFVVAFS